MRLKWALLMLVVVALMGSPAMADVLVTAADFTGSRTTPAASGVSATGNWANGFTISWNISFDGTNWTYVYNSTLGAGVKGDVSHGIIEVSSTFTEANILAGSDSDADLDTWGPSSSNPGIPGNIYGIKFDSDTPFTLVTDRAPIWGDFYAKDGNAGDLGENAAWNTGFGTEPAAAGPFTNWIPVPDTTNGTPGVTPVPLPGVASAAIALLAGLGLTRRR